VILFAKGANIMTKEMKQYLETVVTSIVNEDVASAKTAFHEYLRLKTQVVLGEKEENDDEGSGSGEEEGSDEEGSGSGEEEGSGSGEEDEKKED
jgi:hypothetical protein